MKTPKTLALLERIRAGAVHPDRIDNLWRVISLDLGLPLHQAIEAAKVDLSNAEHADLSLVRPPLALTADLQRSVFDAWIAPDLDQIDVVVSGVLDRAGVSPGDVDRVFTTGGSSFVPAVRERLAIRFGADRLVGGSELTSVAWGLAVRARQLLDR